MKSAVGRLYTLNCHENAPWLAAHPAQCRHGFTGYAVLDIGTCPNLEVSYLQTRCLLGELAS